MASTEAQAPATEKEVPQPAATEPAPAVPDYLASPNAVFGDEGVQWRYGKAPDYSKTRKVWEEGKRTFSRCVIDRRNHSLHSPHTLLQAMDNLSCCAILHPQSHVGVAYKLQNLYYAKVRTAEEPSDLALPRPSHGYRSDVENS